MSNTLFLNAETAIQRIESILDMALIKYNLVVCKDKNPKGEVWYTAQITFTRRDGSIGTVSLDGTSFPDLFIKIADHPKLTQP